MLYLFEVSLRYLTYFLLWDLRIINAQLKCRQLNYSKYLSNKVSFLFKLETQTENKTISNVTSKARKYVFKLHPRYS